MLDGPRLVDDPADSVDPVIRVQQRIAACRRLVELQAPLVAPLVVELLELCVGEVENLDELLRQALDDESRRLAEDEVTFGAVA